MKNIIKKFFNLSNPKGFTLIELVTSIALFAVIGVIAVSMLTFTMRGGKKTENVENIRQHGDVALTKMVRAIRYARSIDVPVCTDSATSQELTVTPLVGQVTTFSCSSIPNTITVDGVPLIDTNTIVTENCSFTCRQPVGSNIPTVSIQFTLTSKDTTGLFENKVSIPFQTSVSMRNINK